MTKVKDVIKAKEGEVFDIELEKDVLDANRKLAQENRLLLKRHRIKAIDIMGAIGAGKTSLFNTISGFYQPQKGKIRFGGRDITRLPAAKRARRGLGPRVRHALARCAHMTGHRG